MTTSRRFGIVTIGGLSLALALVFTGCKGQKGGPWKGLTAPGGGSGQSPIMVRGGAMTFFSFIGYGQDGSMACVQRTLNYIELDRVFDLVKLTYGDVTFKSGGTYPAPDPARWEIDLTGRTWDGAGEDKNFGGVRIAPTNNCVTASGTQPGIDVVIEPLATGGSANYGFYSNNTTQDNATFSRMRYWNKSLIVTATPSGGQPARDVPAPTPNGDEDTTEMIYNIYVSDGTGTTGTVQGVQTAKYRFRCVMAVCDVLIGLN